MQSAAGSHGIASRVVIAVLTILAVLMLAVVALMIYARVRYHINAVPAWLVCEFLFICVALLALAWPNKIPPWLRAPVLSANTFRIGLIGYMIIAFAVMLRLAARYHTGPDSWIFKIAPWLFAFPLPLLVWFTFREWNRSRGQRHSIWNAVLLCGGLAAILYPVFGI